MKSQCLGDVIVSINGQEVERVDHATLVAIIQSCPDRIRMVVVFENWLATRLVLLTFVNYVLFFQVVLYCQHNLTVSVRWNCI